MTWLRCPEGRPGAARRLVCFPHAGGSASFFRLWAAELPALEVHAVQYPGRADRIAEPLPNDVHRLAEEAADAIEPLADLPLALFGHSMGAVVAFETARALERRGVRLDHLFVSGARAADDPDAAPSNAPLRTDDELAEALINLGGTDTELLADPVLRDLVLPYVRSDFEMFERYGYRAGPPVGCPVTAVFGDTDEHVDAGHAAAWGELTDGGFSQHEVPGGHFYLITDPPFRLIEQQLGPVACPTTSNPRGEHG
ncbi:alpha/beta fold hydrolase [Streptomyces sp. NPDC048506]|uniref:thioesterase II family protein n=1 Tax=Streptomyces sp. NPDC048506 TaxID=3155028 RepID=UPI00343CC2D3